MQLLRFVQRDIGHIVETVVEPRQLELGEVVQIKQQFAFALQLGLRKHRRGHFFEIESGVGGFDFGLDNGFGEIVFHFKFHVGLARSRFGNFGGKQIVFAAQGFLPGNIFLAQGADGRAGLVL